MSSLLDRSERDADDDSSSSGGGSGEDVVWDDIKYERIDDLNVSLCKKSEK
jgi:hypothetical protein